MAVSSKMYGQFLLRALNKEVTLGNGATGLKVMLCTSLYVPNQDTHVYKSSVTNEVANGNGYTTGGATLTSVTVSYNATTNTITIDAADVVWSNSTITARYAVIYDSTTGVDGTSPLIGYVDFGEDISSNASNYAISWDSAGIFTISTT